MTLGDAVAGLIGSKPLILVLGAFAIVFLVLAIPAIIVIWAYGFMTAAIFFVAGLLFLAAVQKLELVDTKDYPLLILLPILLGLVGLGMEKLELFTLKPITVSTLAVNGAPGFITADTLLLVIIVVLLVIGLVEK